MFDQTTLDRLAQAIAVRILAYLSNRDGSGSKGNGGQPIPVARRLLTAKEAAAYLGRKSESSIYHLVARREIPCVKHGRNLRFDRVELDRWIDRDKV